MHKLLILMLLWAPVCQASIFGEETIPLIKLVAGQIVELEKLAELVKASEDQINAIKALNDGINKTVEQIESIQAIIERAQGVDPTSIRSIRELNEYLERVEDVKQRVDDLMVIRLKAASMAIAQGSIQGDTAYKMGQEMIGTGSTLAEQSRSASPGRAAQITSASNSAQMMAKGVELQTMAQMVQLQAMSLDLQKAQIEKEMANRKSNQSLFLNTLKQTSKKKVNE